MVYLFHRYIFFHTSLNILKNSCCFFIIIIIHMSSTWICMSIFITITIWFGMGRLRIMSMLMMMTTRWCWRARSWATMMTGWTRTKAKKLFNTISAKLNVSVWNLPWSRTFMMSSIAWTWTWWTIMTSMVWWTMSRSMEMMKSSIINDVCFTLILIFYDLYLHWKLSLIDYDFDYVVKYDNHAFHLFHYDQSLVVN